MQDDGSCTVAHVGKLWLKPGTAMKEADIGQSFLFLTLLLQPSCSWSVMLWGDRTMLEDAIAMVPLDCWMRIAEAVEHTASDGIRPLRSCL